MRRAARGRTACLRRAIIQICPALRARPNVRRRARGRCSRRQRRSRTLDRRLLLRRRLLQRRGRRQGGIPRSLAHHRSGPCEHEDNAENACQCWPQRRLAVLRAGVWRNDLREAGRQTRGPAGDLRRLRRDERRRHPRVIRSAELRLDQRNRLFERLFLTDDVGLRQRGTERPELRPLSPARAFVDRKTCGRWARTRQTCDRASEKGSIISQQRIAPARNPDASSGLPRRCSGRLGSLED